jgi:hypothetical protein
MMDLLRQAFGDTGFRMIHHRVFGKSVFNSSSVPPVWAKFSYLDQPFREPL